ncbi:MAG: hypothetical protein GEV03_11950 [Streptosporangiales bacterium]|nr:hypothetical protein [Streptosporangiales bacterium]
MNGTATAPVRMQAVRRTFRGEPSQVRLVRDFVRRHLGERHDCPEATLEDVLLCVTETATNAIRHTSSGSGGQFTVVLCLNGSAARVEVIDGGPAETPGGGDDNPREEDDFCLPGGLGLPPLLISHSDRMGYEERGQHGVAWFERMW